MTSDHTRRLVDAAVVIGTGEPPDRIDFLHSALCQLGMPRKRSVERVFERQCGRTYLSIQAGRLHNGRGWIDQPLPYGGKPRLTLIHITGEAVRLRSRTVPIGRTLRDFLTTLHVDTNARGYSMFKRQMDALAVCKMSMAFPVGDTMRNIPNMQPIYSFEAWLHPTGEQAVLWPGELELSFEFYETLLEHAVPLDPRALAVLKGSALALDCYTWLAHRLCRVRERAGTRVTWAAMREQFGQEYASLRDFKREFRHSLRSALAVYPHARVEHVDGGVLLKPSRPPIPTTTITVPHRLVEG